MIGNVALRTSLLLDGLPELTAPGRQPAVLSTDSFDGWNQAFAAWPDADDYVLAPGDYRPWGLCRVTTAGTAGRRRSIRFIDSVQKPWDRIPYEAVVGGFDFLAGAAYWVVHGLTLRGPGPATCIVRTGADHITFDSLLIESFLAYGVRLFGNHCTIQNSVVRRMSRGQDGTGVQIRVLGVPNLGNRVLDNEIYDCNDAVQVTWDSKGADKFMECRDLVVEGNDLYLTESRHLRLPGGVYAEAENGIDIKAGPRSTAEPIEFRRNRIWGFRYSAPAADGRASDGAAVTIHRAAQRILFEDNVIFDCPIGFQELKREVDDPVQGSRDVTLRSNVVSLMCQYNTEDLGAVLRNRSSFRLEKNRFSHSHKLSALSEKIGADVFVGNVVHDVPFGTAKTDWDESNEVNADEDDNRVVEVGDMMDLLVERRRWTMRDWAHLHTPVLAQDHIG